MKVPMVSFCDIPLSEIKEHIGKYGRYGIGLTKGWAMRMGLNPVLYMEQNSALAKNLHHSFDKYLVEEGVDHTEPTESQIALADVFRYVKNYQGSLERKTENKENYRFSDEREWRYTPPHSKNYEMMISKEEYELEPKKHDDSVGSLTLRFEPNDIKYIIIDNDKEISEFIRHLHDAKGNSYSYKDVERLTTRILTADQIMEDI